MAKLKKKINGAWETVASSWPVHFSDEVEHRVASGTFTPSAATSNYTVSGLGFQPSRVMLCISGFEDADGGTSYIILALDSASGGYTTSHYVSSEEMAYVDWHTFGSACSISMTNDGFSIAGSGSYPGKLAKKTYYYIALE